jgi:hypothetical protein
MSMWQEFVVGALVSCAVAYTLWVLMPAAAQLRLARRIIRGSEGRAAMGWLRKGALAVESRALKRLGGCGNCSAAASVRREETHR